MSHEDEDFEMARVSEADLRVLLSCTLYYKDKETMKSYCLFDISTKKPKQYRLDRKKDFQQLYLIIRMFRQNMAVAEKYQRQKEVARSVYFYEMGIKE